jgi:hypothetical protein
MIKIFFLAYLVETSWKILGQKRKKLVLYYQIATLVEVCAQL